MNDERDIFAVDVEESCGLRLYEEAKIWCWTAIANVVGTDYLNFHYHVIHSGEQPG